MPKKKQIYPYVVESKHFPYTSLLRDISMCPQFISEDKSLPNMFFDGFFLHLENGGKPEHENNGKYLFFSSDNRKLFDIAVNEIMNHGFCYAQLVIHLMKGLSEYVLFLHWYDGSRCHELFERNRLEYHVKCRGWKSYAKTRVWHSEGYINRNGGAVSHLYRNPIRKIRGFSHGQ